MGKRIQDLDLKMGQKYKCVEAVTSEFKRGETYPVVEYDGGFRLSSPNRYGGCLSSSSLFELVEEEKLEGNFLQLLKAKYEDKVQCTYSAGERFKVGKIYTVYSDGRICSEHGEVVHKTYTSRFIKVEEETEEEPKPLDSEVVTLLNNVLYKVFPEMDGSIENRNVYVEGSKLVKWVDNPWPKMPVKVTLRTCTDGEVQVWEGYKKMLEGLSK